MATASASTWVRRHEFDGLIRGRSGAYPVLEFTFEAMAVLLLALTGFQ